ncbi:hypothetical protein L3Q82_011593, partial [Scortum barcoo]
FRVLEWRVRPIFKPRIQEEQYGFRPGRGTVDQLFTLGRVLEGAREFAQPVYMCFVDLEKAYDHVLNGTLWGALQEYGVDGPSLRGIQSLYCRSVSLVHIAGTLTGLDGSQPECEAAGMRISTSKSEAMVLWIAHSGSERSFCTKWRSLSISGSCSRVREKWIERWTDGSVQRLQCCRTLVWSVVVKRELSQKAKLSTLLVHLHSNPNLWSLALGHDRKNEISGYKQLK